MSCSDQYSSSKLVLLGPESAKKWKVDFKCLSNFIEFSDTIYNSKIKIDSKY